MSFTKKAVIFARVIGVSLVVSISAQAADTVIEIDPGLYKYQETLKVGPQVVLEKQYEYCLSADLAKRNLSELIAKMQEGGNCTVSNLTLVNRRGEADVVCRDPDFGDASGKLDADYTSSSYSIHALLTNSPQTGNAPVSSRVDARRISDCPPGWTPPPGISHK